MFRIRFTEKAVKNLRKIDPSIAKMLLAWISKNLEGVDNPRKVGKALRHDKKGAWRYRVGDYRILAKIEDNILIILIIEVGHRKEIYK
jgi:mRNA interferase RelE/StbE